MSKLNVEAKATIRNKFTFEVEHIDTGKVEKYQAHNIVLDQGFSRLVNFQTYFTNIHVGTGTGTLLSTRTALFAPIANAAAKKSAATVLQERLLPTSRWQRRVVIDPEELVGQTLTEVGIAYGATDSNLCTHALIEDSEGNPISLVKTDTMVITIYADIFIELGELTAMYSGKWRWVHPLENNQLLSYLLGATYPTQQFRVSRAGEFYDGSNHPSLEGVAPANYSWSSNITIGDWTKDAANKKVVTPVRRLGVSDGNGALRCFGLGSSDILGTFRGQLPIPGVFTGHAIEEEIGVGDGAETGFNLSWADPIGLVLKIDDVVVVPEDYEVRPFAKNTDLFSYLVPEVAFGSPVSINHFTDGNDSSIGVINGGHGIVIDLNENSDIDVYRFIAVVTSNRLGAAMELVGANNENFSDSVTISSFSCASPDTYDLEFSPVAFRYYRIRRTDAGTGQYYSRFRLLTADDKIAFNTPPANGEIVTAEYNVDYIPKDSNHVLDLQCAIQYGEG